MNDNRRVNKTFVSLLVLVVCASFMFCAAGSAKGEIYEAGGYIGYLGEARAGAALFHYEGSLYVAGGSTATYSGTVDRSLDSLIVYDIESGEGTRGPSMPVGVTWPAYAEGLDGKFYVIGGWNQSTFSYVMSVQIYDPEAGSWSVAANPTLSSVGLTACALGLDGKMYLFGNGWEWNQTLIYDPEMDAWEWGPDLPNNRWGASAVALSEEAIMVIGGVNGSIPAAIDAVDVYNPRLDSWSSAAPLYAPRTLGASVLAENGYVYHFGGVDSVQLNTAPQASTIARYDPVGDAWAIADIGMSWTRALHAITVDDYGRVFIVGGQSGASTTDSVEMFMLTDASETYRIEIVSPVDGDVVSGTVNVEARVFGALWGWLMAVDLYIDGEFVERQPADSFWMFVWDTTGLVDGSAHVLMVRGFDWNGGITEHSVVVTVSALSLGEKIAQIEAELSSLQADLAALQIAVGEVGDDVTALEAAVASTQEQIDDLESTLSGLIGDLSTTQDLQGDELEALSDALDQLQQQLDDLQEELDDVKTSSDSSSTWGMANLALLVIVLVLVVVVLVMGRRASVPPPPPAA